MKVKVQKLDGKAAGVIEEAKYSGGAVSSLNPFYNVEVVNSTISGNRLEPLKAVGFATGSAIIAGSADLSNSTISGNVGGDGVALNSIYTPPGMTGKSARPGAAAKAGARVQQFVAKARSTSKRGVNKVLTQPVFQSTIVANVIDDDSYDVICGGGCTISGANNLIRSFAGATVPPDTLTTNPQLAPLAYNGGVVVGAPGHPATLPMPTHLLLPGSPAIDQGNNVEGLTTDQRGNGFPRIVGTAADIGAIEGVAAINVPVPALGPWLLALLSGLLGVFGLASRRRRA